MHMSYELIRFTLLAIHTDDIGIPVDIVIKQIYLWLYLKDNSDTHIKCVFSVTINIFVKVVVHAVVK